MPTKLHAILDYVIALISILSPLIFGFGEGNAETLVPICFGMLLILYSFFTDYELGLAREIPFSLHLRMDQFGGILMACSPWLFGFHENVVLPHLLLGTLLIISSLLAGNELITLMNILKHKPWEKWFRMS